jgi:hypothetical protein
MCRAGNPFLRPQPQPFCRNELDIEQDARSEALLPDFVLCHEITQLMAILDRIGNGQLTRI